ncbi:MAG TPA: zinc ribbon domain-containing protein [Bryobacteraceae bacterium]|jgi:putative FmdB family regulatory protein
MPIFEYLCEDCGSKFEKLVRRPGVDEVLCPTCGQSHLEQQHSTFAAHSNGHASGKASFDPGSCPSGMCATPGLCGRNN